MESREGWTKIHPNTRPNGAIELQIEACNSPSCELDRHPQLALSLYKIKITYVKPFSVSLRSITALTPTRFVDSGVFGLTLRDIKKI